MFTMNLADYSAVVVSLSGGKDSQVCLYLADTLRREQGYTGKVVAVHGDTGAEWPQTLGHCQMLCDAHGIELLVARPAVDLPRYIENRCRKLQAAGRKGGWPSMQCRYCTSDCKVAPIRKTIRQLFPHVLAEPVLQGRQLDRVLMLTGERREESSHRARLEPFADVKQMHTRYREVVQWRPVLDHTLGDIWSAIQRSGLPRHVAYDLGNERLSCALCVLATDADIRNGAEHCPAMTEHFLRIERETGHTFKNGKSLAQILGRPEVSLE